MVIFFKFSKVFWYQNRFQRFSFEQKTPEMDVSRPVHSPSAQTFCLAPSELEVMLNQSWPRHMAWSGYERAKGIRVGANFSTTTQFSKNSTGHENCRIAFIFLLNVAPNSLVLWKNSEIGRNDLHISPGARKFFSLHNPRVSVCTYIRSEMIAFSKTKSVNKIRKRKSSAFK